MHLNIELLSNDRRLPSVKYNGGSALSMVDKFIAIPVVCPSVLGVSTMPWVATRVVWESAFLAYRSRVRSES